LVRSYVRHGSADPILHQAEVLGPM
jgi:hypothetical protein